MQLKYAVFNGVSVVCLVSYTMGWLP